MTEIRPITNKKKEIGYYLKSAWIFENPLEKIILAIFIFLGLWKIIGFFF